MKSIALFVVLISVCQAACPGACSGHGKCGEYDKCTCFARWIGNDCSQRECPSGLSWVAVEDNANAPAGGVLGGQHQYTVCSSRGLCTDSGECECFPGYTGRACSRTTCPNDCSGRGRCLYNNQNGYGSNYVQFNSQFWDAAKTRQCACDRGYTGVDCGSRICPKGDDPLTECNSAQGTSQNDKQKITFTSTPAGTSYFTLTFTDMYNGKYTTRPIKMQHSTTAEQTATAADVKSSLEELPNFAIPNVTVTMLPVCSSGDCSCSVSVTDVTDSYECDQIGGSYVIGTLSTTDFTFTIEFVDAANSGQQNPLVVNTADQDTANHQPRYGVNSATTSVAHVALNTNDAYKEHVECSNRGTCDSDSGLCECYEGYTGEACSDQTVFF